VIYFAEQFPHQAMQQHKIQLDALSEAWPVNSSSDYSSKLNLYLTSAAATQVQLDILQTLVEKPWLTNN
jgi:hypothetical protein